MTSPLVAQRCSNLSLPTRRTEIRVALSAYIYISNSHSTNVTQTSLHARYIYNSTIATSDKITKSTTTTGNGFTYSLPHRHNASTTYTKFSTISNNKISGDNLPDAAGATILAAINYMEGQRKSRNNPGCFYIICHHVLFTSAIKHKCPRRPQQGRTQ